MTFFESFGILFSVLGVLFRILTIQSLSRARLFATPWTAVRQASLTITNSWSLLKTLAHRVGDATYFI